MRSLFTLLIFIFSFISLGQDAKIPPKIMKSIPLLAQYLTQGKFSQRDKVTAIHEWITTNIAYEYSALSKKEYLVGIDPNTVLKVKKALSDGYVELMVAMLRAVKIESETIAGYVHDAGWEPGDLTLEAGHAWIAIKINDEWNLADPTWDAGYIGRLPIERKPYKPKKYILPLNRIKNEMKRNKVEEKREHEEEERKEVFDDKPQYKDEIGFVPFPTTEFFLIHPDTFLLTHLPLDPVWQLRKDYVSIEDFALSEDSLKLRLANDGGNNQDFETGIEVYRSRDFLHQFTANGEKGFAYNSYNPGIKATNYYNFMALVHSKNIQRYARGSIYEISEEKYPALLSINDTIIKYTKLYSIFEKELYKNRKEFDKSKYAVSKTRDSDNLKLIKKIGAENDKLTNYVDLNSERIKSDIQRIQEQLETTVESYPSVTNYHEPREGLNFDYLQVWSDSMQIQIDFLKATRDSLIKQRENTHYNTMLTDLSYLDFWLKVNSNSVRFNTYSNNERIEKNDSAIAAHASHMLMLFADSLRTEHVQKDVMGAVKSSSTYVRGSRTVFKRLKTEQKIDDLNAYETYMQAKMVEVLKLALEIQKNSALFNAAVSPAIKNNATVKAIIKLMEKQIEYKEDKKEFIEEQVENEHLRKVSLMDKMREDTKKWKVAYRR